MGKAEIKTQGVKEIQKDRDENKRFSNRWK